MLAFCTSPSEISVVLGPSDAKWLGEEMSFLAELYRSKAASSERQFGEHNNAALASFWETALKCQQLSVALHQAVRRGHRRERRPPLGSTRRFHGGKGVATYIGVLLGIDRIH